MTIVKKTFLVFIIAFIVQLTVISSFIYFGFNRSASMWKNIREEQAYEAVVDVLQKDENVVIEFPGPIAVFDSDMNIVHTNQFDPLGKKEFKGGDAPLVPVFVEDTLIGYYQIRPTNFDDDTANQALLSAMSRILILALFVSLIVSILAALYFSKTISRPADKLAAQLRGMKNGDMDDPVRIKGGTELVNIAEAVEQLRLQIVHEQNLRAQWGQDIAHDLRTPIASIRAQLEGMSDNILEPSSQRFEAMLGELMRIGNLINDLETLMMLESPEIAVHPALIDIPQLFDVLRQRFTHIFGEKQLSFSSYAGFETLYGDESLLRRALSNLLSNAYRYSDEGSTVTMRAYENEDGFNIGVHNWGVMITEEEKEKIFNRLYRGEFARKTPGSGLGLTIVYQIAQLHQASVSVDSGPERGTVFTLTFPHSNSHSDEEA